MSLQSPTQPLYAPVSPRSVSQSRYLWTLVRRDYRAHCVVTATTEGHEVRVHLEGQVILQRAAGRIEDMFALAELWRERLWAAGWAADVTLRPKPDRRRAPIV